ncbi:glycoside hydrolase family 28 protein [Nonomuraea rubra]|uniref:Polygalacturonase n=1 Tax=Nonomuraea rubra TaxID=46180 RepID=A0A7X0NTM9_9ACTN|nr:glycoside hydrolase family 28 protein [Nonomuraea rubra]MBB6549423.1 polygalacturonase [Nonomuraea rubra]
MPNRSRGLSWSRRDAVRAMALSAVVPLGLDAPAAQALSDPWARANRIAAKVRGPRFPHRRFDIRKYGAVGDGVTDCTAAIRTAIRACHAAGGGHVDVPEGRFLTGAVHLLSNVDLHVAEGATLLFSTDPRAYLPLVLTRFEGVELLNYSPLIYAYGQHDVAVTGAGVLDGQADDDHWWPWKGSGDHGWEPGEPRQAEARAALFAQAEQGVPVEQRTYGEGGYLRPSFVQPYRCRNVLIEGVTIVNSPMWEIHPTLSENVLVRGVTVRTHGPNNDGCNPESSRLVVIRDCTFDTGDDCIAIKSGRNADGRRVNVPSEHILVEGCTFREGHGGMTIGSEMSGGVREVFIRDCTMSSPDLDIALRFKTNSVRGGFVEGFHARNLEIGQVGGSVIDIDFNYEEGPGHGFNPVVGGIDVRDVTVSTANRALNLRGYADAPIRGVTLTDVDFGTIATPSVVQHVEDLVLRNVLANGEPLIIP